jgi:hypothetical protein
MTQRSTNLRIELADLLLNMSGNKRGCKQRTNKHSKAAPSSLGDQGGEQAMEVYYEISHEMETSRDSMCESEREKDKTSHTIINQGLSKLSWSKPAERTNVSFTQYG